MYENMHSEVLSEFMLAESRHNFAKKISKKRDQVLVLIKSRMAINNSLFT